MNASANLHRLNGGRESRTETLGEAVKAALDRYFETLDGHHADDLYRMVIEEVERPLLECVMFHCGGNQTRAANTSGSIAARCARSCATTASTERHPAAAAALIYWRPARR
jgi:Fis family transcriptional regulator